MSRINKMQKDEIVFNTLAYSFITIFSLCCLIPFLFIISGSFSSERSIIENGFSLIPGEFSLQAYKTVFAVPESILRAYGVTIFITVTGTLVGLFLSAMTAYVLQRKEFKYRNVFSFYFYFTSLFSGGLVPWYILMVRYLNMKNNILALILPSLFNIFYIIIIRSFIYSSIPDSISESAKIDGAGDFKIFIKLVLPLSKPVLATIGLFIAIGYWNNWFNAMLFIDKSNMLPLQYYLYKLLSQITMLRTLISKVPQLSVSVTPPEESFKMAMTVVTIGPIIFLYPFLQKYFVKGIMIGAVKG
ncbi:sugar ABC transporter permease [Clostridium thermosuccinogenes]|uniref:Sugar ABC transporter permease n=1 Tax=Clostridium thermosuccinogenes TaxID=84032 RepID=A0A2K2FQR8_9CLOT|nr:carbohydrate ABC transporter permease [Pseudoclostridium thermosuccinogenes]AUS96048.1 sugar ABC transporter permease [Pseudoclostridium thermosuccinogenes]PNT99436.1 sugar ABC transporter permease [Pseudoclostridium thermosuccinogenes]PNU01123.1 sugar ABC transporter permease [Pseudoclostridium thermosuccinogenes]